MPITWRYELVGVKNLINGIINVYKEKGYTSHDVVAKLRGILKQKKIGHTGTLDPDAVGVLPICLGNGTKLCDLLTDKDKTYEAVLLLGTVTDTQDTSGTVLVTKDVTCTKDEITEAILSFVGVYEQLPPMYSAIKINGKRLYELARAGLEVERKTRTVCINGIHIHNIDEQAYEVRLTVECSKGTYIRTLCHDIGEKLGCGGCMKSLERTKVGQFLKEDSLTIDQIRDLVNNSSISDKVIPVDVMFPDYDKVFINEEAMKFVYNGNNFTKEQCLNPVKENESPFVLVYDCNHIFVAIYQFSTEEKIYKPVKMFL